MKKRVGIVLALCFAATSFMTGCKKDDSASAKGKKEDILATWKPAEELQKIQGSITVDGSKWVVNGDKVTITSNTTTKEATLDLSEPCQLKVVQDLGGGAFSSDIYGYARNGEDIYIGSGTAGIKFGDIYMVGKDGAVVFDGTVCNYFAEQLGMKGFKAPIEVEGGLTDKEGKKYFNFALPDSFRKGEFRKYSLEVVGTALLDEQFADNLIQR